MRGFFKGWRRKIGLLTLLMACVFMGGWLRSAVRLDFFVTSCGSRSSYFVESDGGTIQFARRTPATRGRLFTYGFCERELEAPANGANRPVQKPFGELGIEWRTDWLGFHFGAGRNSGGTIRLIEFWIIPYWAIVIPLAVLSAYLLLSMPPQSTSKNTVEPIVAEGT